VAVDLNSRARTREVTGALYLERWIQIDAGTDQIYGTDTSSGDLNSLDSQADTLTSASSGRMWYGAASPGEYDAGESNAAWYGQVVRVPFRRLQGSAEWHTLKAEILAFVEAAFPQELILEANRRFDRPPVSDDVSAPAKYVIWTIEYD
jgi:hypothetical protein